MKVQFFSRFFAAVCCVSLFTGADWLQFRGNNANGISEETSLPVSWSDSENIAWKSPLPGRGLSGPIVVGDKVFVTSSSGFEQDRLHVLCFDTASGDKMWERQFWATGRTMCHPKMCVATPTPASDGKRIFAFYSSNDVICLDLEGNLLWFRGLTHDFPNVSNSLGMASSPVVVGDTLIVQTENDADSFSHGIDVRTGISRWKMSRPQVANWSSPTILRGKTSADDLALLQSSEDLIAVDPKSGEVIWSYDDGGSRIPSSTVFDGKVFVPTNGITALQPIGSSGPPKVLWQENRLSASTPSPLVFNDHVYTVNRAGVVVCADVKDGKVQWQLRLKGPFTGTPIVAANRLYLFNEKGLGQVVQLGGEKGEIVGEGDLGETILCSPAAAQGALFVRSDGHLWKIAEK